LADGGDAPALSALLLAALLLLAESHDLLLQGLVLLLEGLVLGGGFFHFLGLGVGFLLLGRHGLGLLGLLLLLLLFAAAGGLGLVWAFVVGGGGVVGVGGLLCGSWRVLRTKLGRRLLCHLCLLVRGWFRLGYGEA